MAAAAPPDSPGQSIHRDQWAFDFFEFPSDHHVQCNTIWALTDFTEANGATRLMPGSQDLPNDHGHTVDETVPAEMSKGSCLLYTGKVKDMVKITPICRQFESKAYRDIAESNRMSGQVLKFDQGAYHFYIGRLKPEYLDQ